MLIFKESGRLGNQIFQYAALRSLCKEKEKLLLLGFNDLKLTFNEIDAQIINPDGGQLKKLMYRRFYPCLNWLSELGLISNLSEIDRLDNYRLIEKSGLFNSLKFVKEGYFQNQNSFNPEVVKKLTFRNGLLSNAKNLLSTISPSKTNIFVHIRRGDYLFWTSKETPAVLPASYYKKCIEIISSKISNPFFIFTSDDHFYVQDIFGDLSNSYISRNSSIEDFSLMSHCQGGILSASSFSWWAAYFAHQNYPNGLFIAPEYWAGHSVNSWFPPNIESKFLTYTDSDFARF